MTAAIVTHLEAATADAARPERALDALLAAWRLQPAPAIAEAIAELTPRLPHLPHPIARRKHWQGVLAAGRAVDVAGLVDALDSDWAPAALVQLIHRPPDPRITVALAERLERAPDAGGQRLIAYLVEVGDPRTVEAVARQLGIDAPATQALRARAAAAATLAPEVTAALGRYRAARAAHLAAERILLAAVYAAPDDDEPRLVYGDWLQGHDDPRGELIALQFRRHRGRMSQPELARERALLAVHRRAWLDGLDDPVVEARSYARGFVDEVVLRAADAALEPLLASPAWATVRTIELGTSSQGHLARLVALPAMRSLRSLIYVHSRSYDELNALPAALGLEHLTISCNTVWRDPDTTMEVGPALASVTSITSLAFPGPRWLPGSALLPQLRRLQTLVRPAEAPWLASVLARGDALERVEVSSGELELALVAGARRLSRLEVRAEHGVWYEQVIRWLVPLVAALPATAFTELVVVGHHDVALDVALAPLRAHQRELATVTYQAPS